MKKQKTNKVKTVVYLIHFILIDIWARNGVLHIFLGAPSYGLRTRVIELPERNEKKHGVPYFPFCIVV